MKYCNHSEPLSTIWYGVDMDIGHGYINSVPNQPHIWLFTYIYHNYMAVGQYSWWTIINHCVACYCWFLSPIKLMVNCFAQFAVSTYSPCEFTICIHHMNSQYEFTIWIHHTFTTITTTYSPHLKHHRIYPLSTGIPGGAHFNWSAGQAESSDSPWVAEASDDHSG